MFDLNNLLDGIDVSHFNTNESVTETVERTVNHSERQSWLCDVDIWKPNLMTMEARQAWFKSLLSDRFHVDFSLENDTYHKHNYLSSSKLLRVKGKTEIQARKLLNKSVEETAAMRRGTAIHDVIEQIILNSLTMNDVEKYLESFIVAPVFKRNSKSSVEQGISFYEKHFKKRELNRFDKMASKANNEFAALKLKLDAMQKACPLVVTEDIHKAIKGLVKELKRLPYVLQLLRQGIAELSLFDRENELRIRPDVFIPAPIYGKAIHISVKTTGDMNIYERLKYKGGYNAQTGMYGNILEAALEQEVIHIICVIEIKDDLVQIKLQEVSELSFVEYEQEYFDTLAFYRKIMVLNEAELKGYEAEFDNQYGIEVL